VGEEDALSDPSVDPLEVLGYGAVGAELGNEGLDGVCLFDGVEVLPVDVLGDHGFHERLTVFGQAVVDNAVQGGAAGGFGATVSTLARDEDVVDVTELLRVVGPQFQVGAAADGRASLDLAASQALTEVDQLRFFNAGQLDKDRAQELDELQMVWSHFDVAFDARSATHCAPRRATRCATGQTTHCATRCATSSGRGAAWVPGGGGPGPGAPGGPLPEPRRRMRRSRRCTQGGWVY
jgi:hypothetical protein